MDEGEGIAGLISMNQEYVMWVRRNQLEKMKRPQAKEITSED